jgi:hypothetical protein
VFDMGPFSGIGSPGSSTINISMKMIKVLFSATFDPEFQQTGVSR